MLMALRVCDRNHFVIICKVLVPDAPSEPAGFQLSMDQDVPRADVASSYPASSAAEPLPTATGAEMAKAMTALREMKARHCIQML